MTGEQYAAEWSLWSTTVRVAVRDPQDLEPAQRAVASSLAAMDRVANRFDASSEVSALARMGATEATVSPLLADTLRLALRVAEATGGAVDPTLGWAMVDLGYDRAWTGSPWEARPQARVTARWHDVRLSGRRLTLPDGVLLDLGAVGKAYAVDRAAEAAHAAVGGPVLVAVGGDLRACGTPPGEPWMVEVAEQPTGDAVGWVHVLDGAVATSSTTSRTWASGGRTAHHVLDPGTLRPVDVHWRTATVAAATCVDANAASTAALVKGPAAVTWLRAQRLPARLVHRDGTVQAVAGWPERDAA